MPLDDVFGAQLTRIEVATATIPDTDISAAIRELGLLEVRLAKALERQPRLEAAVPVGNITIGYGAFDEGRRRGFFADLSPTSRVSVLDNPRLLLMTYDAVGAILTALEVKVSAPA